MKSNSSDSRRVLTHKKSPNHISDPVAREGRGGGGGGDPDPDP